MSVRGYKVHAALFLLVLGVGGTALLVGPAASVGEAGALWWRLLRGAEIGDAARAILYYRGMRVAAALCIGAALSTCGASLQALLRNPLADPYILGIASGGGFGAAVATACGWGIGVGGFSAVNLCAFAGALLAIGVGYVVARSAGILSAHALLLAGVMVGAFFTSLILLVLAIVPARDQHAVFLWLMGDLGSPDITPGKVGITAAITLGSLVALVLMARPLDLIALGEEAAYHHGLGVERFKLAVIAVCSLATASCVALAGPIGFIGVVVPHALRKILGPRHLPLLTASAVGGAALLLTGDVLVRASSDYLSLPVVPVGVFTALIGAPYFLVILKRRPN